MGVRCRWDIILARYGGSQATVADWTRHLIAVSSISSDNALHLANLIPLWLLLRADLADL